jgi:hypothetical protein
MVAYRQLLMGYLAGSTTTGYVNSMWDGATSLEVLLRGAAAGVLLAVLTANAI